MTVTLIPLIVFLLGLILYVLPIAPKANEIGRVLMLAGAIGFCLSGRHSLSIQ
jgi:hypothetical protein